VNASETWQSSGWDFRGRGREVAALEAGWRAGAAGHGAPVIVVHGEAGIGKTRTVTEFARAVRALDAEVLSGAAYEGGLSTPYGVWREAASSYLEQLGDDGLQRALGDGAGWLALLVPDGMCSQHVPVGVSVEMARVRLAEAFARMLDASPVQAMLILDDMQWADPDSLELLGQVARLMPQLLIVVIFRGISLELGHPLARRLADIQRQRPCEYLPLGSLSRGDGGQLLEQAAGTLLEANRVDALYELSGGNPFFLGELGRYLASHGDATIPSAMARVSQSRSVPRSGSGWLGWALRPAGCFSSLRCSPQALPSANWPH
jgi:predicted ATPase